MTTQKVAKAYDKNSKTIKAMGDNMSNKINWETYDKYLGVVTDESLAEKIGCTVAAVWGRRQKLNINSFSEKNREGKPLETKAQVMLENIMSKGNVSEIAKSLGVTRQHLYNLKEGKYNLENISIGLCRSLKNQHNIDYEDWFEEVE